MPTDNTSFELWTPATSTQENVTRFGTRRYSNSSVLLTPNWTQGENGSSVAPGYSVSFRFRRISFNNDGSIAYGSAGPWFTWLRTERGVTKSIYSPSGYFVLEGKTAYAYHAGSVSGPLAVQYSG